MSIGDRPSTESGGRKISDERTACTVRRPQGTDCGRTHSACIRIAGVFTVWMPIAKPNRANRRRDCTHYTFTQAHCTCALRGNTPGEAATHPSRVGGFKIRCKTHPHAQGRARSPHTQLHGTTALRMLTGFTLGAILVTLGAMFSLHPVLLGHSL